MKLQAIIVLILLFVNPSFGQDSHLMEFEKFMGEKWIGHYQNSEDSNLIHILKWSFDLDEQIVKMVKTVDELGFKMETNFYWDMESEQLTFISFTNKSMVSKGKAEFINDRLMLEGKSFFIDGFSLFKIVFHIDNNKNLVDEFFRIQEDADVQGHLIKYISELD